MQTTNSPRLRPSARAIIVDEDDRVLLCRFEFDRPEGPFVVWAMPGGGVEPGETLLQALRRELAEEVGLSLTGHPPHVWHQEVVAEGHAAGYDGVLNDYFLVRAERFQPRGTMTDVELAAEYVTGFRWWSQPELVRHQGPALFSPRALPHLLAGLLAEGPGCEPIAIGL